MDKDVLGLIADNGDEIISEIKSLTEQIDQNQTTLNRLIKRKDDLNDEIIGVKKAFTTLGVKRTHLVANLRESSAKKLDAAIDDVCK